MSKDELRNLIRQAIAKGDMKTAQMYKEQLIKELEYDSFMRVAFAKDLDDFIEMGIWHGDC